MKHPANIEIQGDKVFVHGPMTFQTVPYLNKMALQFSQVQPIPKVIDLHDVTHADSSALALLLEWQAWAKKRGHQFDLINVPTSLLALGQVMGMDELLPMQAAAPQTN